MSGPKAVWSQKQETDKQALINMALQGKGPDEIFRFLHNRFGLKGLKSMYHPGSALQKAWDSKNKGDMAIDYVGWMAGNLSKANCRSEGERQAFIDEYKKLGNTLESFESNLPRKREKDSYNDALKQLGACRKKLVSALKSELKRVQTNFGQLDEELQFRMKYAGEYPAALFHAEEYEKKKTGGRSGEMLLRRAYFEALEQVVWEKQTIIKHKQICAPVQYTQNEVIAKIDFTQVPIDTFDVYFRYSDPKKAERLSLMHQLAEKKYNGLIRQIYHAGLLEHFGGRDDYRDLQSKAFEYSFLADSRKFVADERKRAVVRMRSNVPTMSEMKYRKPPMRKDQHVWKMPAYGIERLQSPDAYRYFDPTVGTWVDKQTLNAIRSHEKPDYSLVPIVGPVIDAVAKYDEIKTKNGIPKAVRTYDRETGTWKHGKVRLIGKDKVELTTWNPQEKKWDKRIEKRPKAGWTDYAALTMYVAFAVLDAVFVGQAVTRSAARKAGARTLVARGGESQKTYFRAMTELEREESVRLLNIAREKRSWPKVFKGIKAVAKGGEITPDVIRTYIKKEWGGGVVRRGARRVTKGFKDFFGNLLTPVSRKKYQAKVVAEFFNEMRMTTDFATMKKIAESMRAAGLTKAEQKMAVRAMFEAMTSFSRSSQKAMLRFVEGPGRVRRVLGKARDIVLFRKGQKAAPTGAEAWKNLLKNIEKAKKQIRRAKRRKTMARKVNLTGEEVAEAIRQGLAETLPQFKRALAYGPNFRALEAAAYLYLIPKASQEPLNKLMIYLDKKAKIEAREIERRKLILELSDVYRIMHAKPVRAE